MDDMCNKSEAENSNNKLPNVEVMDYVKRCGSPVFKCVNHTKGVRGNNLDSSDYDIPSYQINQSTKGKNSSKYGSESNESVLPLSPILSPIPTTTSVQFQPPSIHSLGTVAKILDKSSKNNERSFAYVNKDATKSYKPFECLGMNDKDISWVSSMASPPPKQVPGSQFNTLEKATFLPEEKFLSIQPRALFSPNLDDDFGCHPISFCSESEDEEAYKSNIRLSDVCATLKQLEVKSLDQPSDHSVEDVALRDDSLISPVMRMKKRKPESVKKKKKGILVVSPNDEHNYEFSVGESKIATCDKSKSDDANNLIEDDSFQSISFSGLDELCKTLVAEGSNSSAVSKSGDCDKTLANSSSKDSAISVPKIFYYSKTSTDIYEASSLNNLYSYVMALEEGNSSIPGCCKINKSFAEKGIVRLDVLNKDLVKLEEPNKPHTEVIEDKEGGERKYGKMNDENSGWEKMKQYLSESQLNVSEGEIFRTVENLEKTLASQDSKEKFSQSYEAELSLSQKSGTSSTSRANSKRTREEENSEYVDESTIASSGHFNNAKRSIVFTNVLGSRIFVSKEALEKGMKILKDCDEECRRLQTESLVAVSEGISLEKSTANFDLKKHVHISTEHEIIESSSEKLAEKRKAEGADKLEKNFEGASVGGHSTGSEKIYEKINVFGKTLEKGKTLMQHCDEASNETSEEQFFDGYSTGTGKKMQTSAEALKEAKALMRECGENSTGKFDMGTDFSISSSQELQVSERAIEEKRAIETNYANLTEPSDSAKSCPIRGFMTSSGKAIHISAKSLEKAKALMADCSENFSEKPGTMGTDSFTSSDEKIHVLGENENHRAKYNINLIENYPDFKGFSTCSGKSISVSVEGLKKARVLLKNCELELNDEIHQAVDNCERDFDKNHSVCFSTASGNKVKVTEKALKKAKSLWCENEESIMQYRGKKEANEVKDKKGDCVAGNEKTSCDDLEEDWDKIIPPWLHVYTTSPSVASDRAELSPLVALEDGQSSREYIVKSPVLGASDRFHGKKKRRRLRFEAEVESRERKHRTGFVVPYKVSGRKTAAKRTSGLRMDFSVPFKKAKFVVAEAVVVDCDVKEERAKKRKEQEKAIKEKNKVKPIKGLHLSRKSSEKQKSWIEAVGGSPPEVHSEETLKSFGMSEAVLHVRITNAVSFSFSEDFFGPNCKENIEGFSVGDGCVLILDDENKVGLSECKRAFLASPGVQPSLVPEGWVENHYKWIVWKLAHYERSFPHHFAGKCLTPDNVMLQLKYRYDREIDRSERSALKKILEKDDTPAKRLVLCVCGIKKIEFAEDLKYELTLTDGWYSCPARPDPAMTRILDEGKLCVGTKLMIQGAVLVNSEQGISPLEMTEDVYLKISTNSTRRVRWDTKLGFQKNPRNFPISLSSILAQGGPISRLDIIIVRVYPVLYMEKTSDGYHVTRNRRSEEKAEAEFRKFQEQKVEVICNEVLLEMKKSVNSETKSSSLCLNNFAQEDETSDLLDCSSDTSAFQDLMAADPKKALEHFRTNQNDLFSRELSKQIEKKLENENFRKRNVSEFFRAKIVDLRKPDYNNPAVLSIWHPSEDLMALISEGKVFSLLNVAIGNSSRACKHLQIHTTRQTHYVPVSRSVKYPSRKVTSLQDVSSKVSPAFEEVDVVGVVVLVRDISYGSRQSQVAYLTDGERNFVGIVFWGSCKNYGWENVLRVQCIVACSNLQWKKNTCMHDVPSLYVNENSVFTENPKQSYMKQEIEKLKQMLSQVATDFLTRCEEHLLTKLEESKWVSNRKRNSLHNECASKGAPKGLNSIFESRPTASSTPIKPSPTRTLAAGDSEPSPIQKRIEKLQSYGEPPSLIPLVVRNNLRRRNNRRSSLASNPH